MTILFFEWPLDTSHINLCYMFLSFCYISFQKMSLTLTNCDHFADKDSSIHLHSPDTYQGYGSARLTRIEEERNVKGLLSEHPLSFCSMILIDLHTLVLGITFFMNKKSLHPVCIYILISLFYCYSLLCSYLIFFQIHRLKIVLETIS